MSPILRNIIAVIVGFAAGSFVNMGLITISGTIIPPPEGADTATMEGLKASMQLFEPKHFVFPFLAHALGTLAGAWIAAMLAASHKMWMAMIIGIIFLFGGISGVVMLPSPLWFSALDLVVAYIPMAYIGYRLGAKKA
jgi:hypothetical protein